MDETPPAPVTQLLQAWSAGDDKALERLVPVVYGELRILAQRRMLQENIGASLQPTALVHELYLRLYDLKRLDFPDRIHFLAYAARAMRSIIIDLIRERRAARRGADALHLTLTTDVVEAIEAPEREVLRLHDALTDLESVDERLVRVVEMRYFAGLTEAEIAASLGVTERTVRRDWQKARLLLFAALA